MKDPLIVVTGLPRSGTSMMMGALEAGGVPLVVDGKREADVHNQRGYFEHEGVKSLESSNEWLRECRGKAVKIIYRQLYFIPEGLPAKLVFMRRDVREVVRSQNEMLGEPEGVGDWSRLLTKELFKVEKHLRSRPELEVLNVAHRRVFSEAREVFDEVREFLGQALDLEAMVKTVRPELYRQR